MIDLKILHITYSLRGGAGISAYRFHHALLSNGADTRIFSLDHTSILKDYEEAYSLREYISGKQVSTSLANRFFSQIKKLSGIKRIKNSRRHEIVSLNFFNDVYLNRNVVELSESFDVIVLHWVANMLNISTINEISKRRKLFLYLHDSNFNLGIFHYALEKKDATIYARTLDKILRAKKKNSYFNNEAVFLSPSEWLKLETEKTNRKRRVFYLPYSIPAHEMKTPPLGEKTSCPVRKRKNTISFVSQNTNNKRKGIIFLLNALEYLTGSIEVIVVGKAPQNETPVKNKGVHVHYTGELKREELNVVYKNSDLFVLPSLQDNMPNTMIESLVNGCPVISFKVGGMSEVIIDGFNGFLAEEITSQSLGKTIEKGLSFKKEFHRDQISKQAKEKFLPERQFRFFEKILNEV